MQDMFSKRLKTIFYALPNTNYIDLKLEEDTFKPIRRHKSIYIFDFLNDTLDQDFRWHELLQNNTLFPYFNSLSLCFFYIINGMCFIFYFVLFLFLFHIHFYAKWDRVDNYAIIYSLLTFNNCCSIEHKILPQCLNSTANNMFLSWLMLRVIYKS